MPPAPRVAVLVVNWNRSALLAACLGSLKAQTFTDFEVILVDNGSQDDSLAVARKAGIERLRIIENRENRGFCAANNQGIEAAQGEFVALLNNDAEAEPGWLAALVEAADSPRTGLVASKILVWETPETIDKVGHLIYPDGQNRGRGHGERDQGQYDRPEPTLWPDGCAALYRRSMLAEIGGFDEDFFAYADDAELGLRARAAGWEAVYAPEAVVRHHRGATLGRYSPKRLFLIERNRLWLVAKHFPWRMWPGVPYFYGKRLLASARAARAGVGDAALAQAESSASRLIQCLIRAHLAALLGLPKMLAKRRRLASTRRLSSKQIVDLLERYRIGLDELVSRSG